MNSQNLGQFQKVTLQNAGIPRFQRGVNLGNFLESKVEGNDTNGLLIQDEWFPLLKDKGFDFVRMPVRWSVHAEEPPPYSLDEAFLKRVTHLVDTALASGLAVIINHHHYFELMREPQAHRERFCALWRAISQRFKGYPDELFFELLNEPNHNLTSSLWNEFLKEAYTQVREEGKSRVLVVIPADYDNIPGNDIPGLDLLSLAGLENDPRLVVSFHYYEPHSFTHQGAPWENPPPPVGRHWTASSEERKALQSAFSRAMTWGEKEKRPLFLGEFGVYQKYASDREVILWTQSVREEAEKQNIPWCFWDFCTDFGVWDRERKAFKEKLLHALVP